MSDSESSEKVCVSYCVVVKGICTFFDEAMSEKPGLEMRLSLLCSTILLSGHFHWEYWGLIYSVFGMLLHQSDCLYIIKDSQLADYRIGRWKAEMEMKWK